MSKINEYSNKLSWLHGAGFFIILALPILVMPPYFYPADWGKSIVFRSVLAAVLLLFMWQLLSKKVKINFATLKNNKIIYALGALFLIFALATIFSVDSTLSLWGNPIRGGGFVTLASYFIFAVLAAIMFKKDDWRKAFDLSIIIGALVSVIAVIQYYGLLDKFFAPELGRPASTMGNPIALGVYLLFLFFIASASALKEKFLPKKIFYGICILLFLFGILISGSRAAWLGLAVGGLSFVLLYPKKMTVIKISAIICLILGALFVGYVNSATKLPSSLENNRVFKAIQQRLSFSLIFADPRFSAWSSVDTKILLDKPILGYGPENFSVGFDKNYNPALPYLSKNWGSWWDRAHNILFDIGAQAGILAIIAYLCLFVVVLWQLQKVKNKPENQEDKTIVHGAQTALIAYFVGNLFWFDTFSTYLIFFLLVGYALHLTSESFVEQATNQPLKFSKPIMAALCVIVLIFLWQYNFVPFLANAKINKAEDLAKRKYCADAISLMDKALQTHSFIDSYARMEYVQVTKVCNDYFPENTLTYLKRDFELIKKAVKIQPLYTRYWIMLGNTATSLAAYEQDANTKDNLLNEANQYFIKASGLAPKHQETLLGQAQMKIVAKDYKGAQELSQNCIALDSSIGDCYFYLGLAQIYLDEAAKGKENITLASGKLYDIESRDSLGKLSDAYGSIPDFKELIAIYLKLIKLYPENAQYHSSLAFFYKENRQYKEAKEEALKVLEFSPESKPNVDQFLKTLPY